MKYCQNCGKQIDTDAKFCPYCGGKTGISDNGEGVFTKMEKGVVKSLKNKLENKAVEKTQNLFTKTNTATEITDNTNVSNKTVVPLLLYILFSVLIYLTGSFENDITGGIILFTVMVLAVYFIRRKKEPRINWLAIIFLLLQALLIFSFLMEHSEMLLYSTGTSIVSLIFTAMLLSIGYLILKRKKLK